MICITCETAHQENFCPNCGERAGVPKITFKSMFAETFSTVTNMDKGFLLNLKYLSLNPRQLVTNYLQGKRKGIFNPISFLILAVTIYLIVDSLIDVPNINSTKEIKSSDKSSALRDASLEAGRFVHAYIKYFWILTIFWLGVATKLMFGKYNFAEHLTINSFIIGYATLLGLIGKFIFGWILIFNPLIYLIVLVLLYRIFENKRDRFGSFIQALVALILFVIQFFLIVVAIGIIRTQIL